MILVIRQINNSVTFFGFSLNHCAVTKWELLFGVNFCTVLPKFYRIVLFKSISSHWNIINDNDRKMSLITMHIIRRPVLSGCVRSCYACARIYKPTRMDVDTDTETDKNRCIPISVPYESELRFTRTPRIDRTDQSNLRNWLTFGLSATQNVLITTCETNLSGANFMKPKVLNRPRYD